LPIEVLTREEIERIVEDKLKKLFSDANCGKDCGT